MKDDLIIQRRAYLQQNLGRSRISRTLGLVLRYDEDGRAEVDLPYNPMSTNGVGSVHGGVVGVLIDAAGWYATAQHYDTWVGTVEFKVHLLQAIVETDLKAVASVIRRGKRLASTEVEVITPDGTLVALGSTTCGVTSRTHEGWPPGDRVDSDSNCTESE